MYQAVLGASTAAASAVVLPNTAGSTTGIIISLVGIALGSIIVLSSVIRLVAKKAYKA